MEANIVKHLLKGTVALRLRWDKSQQGISFVFASNILRRHLQYEAESIE
jgi:hypothetical protein